MMRSLCLIAALLVCSLAIAKPVPPKAPPVEKKPVEIPIPDMGGETNYGTLSQEGRELTIIGPIWWAKGEFRKDGSVYLLWYEVSTGRKAPSVYRLSDPDTLTGVWGWEEEVTVDDAGALVGTLRRDVTVRRKPPMGPEF